MEINIIGNKPIVHMSLEEYKDLMVTINELEEELHKYKSGHGHYAAQCKKLDQENDELREQLKTIENERMELFGLNEGACKEIAGLSEKNTDLRMQVKYYREDAEGFFKERCMLKDQLKDAQDNICLLEEENEALKKEHQRLNEKIEELEYKYNGLDMSKTIDRLYTEIERYKMLWRCESSVSLRLGKENQILQDKLAAIEEIIEGES